MEGHCYATMLVSAVESRDNLLLLFSLILHQQFEVRFYFVIVFLFFSHFYKYYPHILPG